MDGELRAPRALIASERAEKHTGFAVYGIHPTIIGGYDQNEGKYVDPNFYAIMVRQRLPGFIRFDEAGVELVRRVVVAFLRKGYVGKLNFFQNAYKHARFSNAAHCNFAFEPWRGMPVCDEEGPQPARVRLGWESWCYGKQEDIAPIVAVCRSLNLREYVPTTSAEVVP